MSLSAQITPAGITIPQFSDVLEQIKTVFRGIYGQDIYIEDDSEDGQWLAILASLVNDNNQQAVSTYNAFSPSTAQGNGLAGVVKINGLLKKSASRSSVDVLIGGQAGTEITNGIAGDTLGNQWSLPPLVTIPVGGSIVVTAVCTVDGAVQAPANSVTRIVTPTRGWQTVTNALAAVAGDAVEDDATLRMRQSVSTGLPALSVLDSIIGSIANLPGVQRYQGYENDQGTPDADGIPGHSISLVILGGDAQSIAETIALKKTPGTGTHGTTSEIVIDPKGVPNLIHFYQLALVRVKVKITIDALPGYTSSLGTALVAAVANYISTLPIGDDVRWNKLWAPANLNDVLAADLYDVTDIQLARFADPFGTANVVIAFNEAASCAIADITLITNP